MSPLYTAEEQAKIEHCRKYLADRRAENWTLQDFPRMVAALARIGRLAASRSWRRKCEAKERAGMTRAADIALAYGSENSCCNQTIDWLEEKIRSAAGEP